MSTPIQKKPLDIRITRLFKKWIVSRPNGNCQVLFALTELLEELVREVEDMKPILWDDNVYKHHENISRYNTLDDIVRLLKEKMR